MDKKHYAKRCGSLDQIAYARKSVLTDGKAEGMKVIDIDNGSGLSLTLLESRCLDIARLSFRGVNMGFLSKAGLVSPQNYSSVSGEFTKYFQAGMLYTCGLENTGPPSEKNGQQLPLHGSIGMISAENVYAVVDWENEKIVIKGDVRQSALFGKNILLKRKITIPLHKNKIYIEDTLVNEGFLDEDIMLLYHINFGYPMLSEKLKLDINHEAIEPRDEVAKKGIDKWNTFEMPTTNRPEEVFYHCPKKESDGLVHVTLNNTKLDIEAEIVFDKKQLPELIEWKSMASGDYALGVEPATALVGGYAKEKEAGRVKTIKPGEKLKFNVTFKFS